MIGRLWFSIQRILIQAISLAGKPKRFLKASTKELLAFGEISSKGETPLFQAK